MKDFDITDKSFYFDSIFESLYPRKKEKQRSILSNGDVIYSSNDTAEYNFFDYYNSFCQNTIYNSLETPYIICTGIGNLVNLENLNYSDDEIEYLNNHGLYVFLWDILLSTDNKEERFEIKNTKTFEPLKNILVPNKETPVYSFELESIRTFVQKNNLKKVTVITCEYDTSAIYQPYYSEFKICSSNNIFTCYRNEFSDFKKNVESSCIKHKFISLSLRYEVHRHLIVSYIVNLNSVVSWKDNGRSWDDIKEVSLEYLNNELTFNIFDWKETYPKQFFQIETGNQVLAQQSPIRLQSEIDKEIKCGCSFKLPLEEIVSSFCFIITESTYQKPFPNLSEKTINSIVTNRPFILVSTPNSLRYLKELGFKTFDRWWDESYDQEQDHEKRILKIFDVIDYIDSLPIEDLQVIYDQMKDVLEFNAMHLETLKHNLKIFY